jgi:hypothetical protein
MLAQDSCGSLTRVVYGLLCRRIGRSLSPRWSETAEVDEEAAECDSEAEEYSTKDATRESNGLGFLRG